MYTKQLDRTYDEILDASEAFLAISSREDKVLDQAIVAAEQYMQEDESSFEFPEVVGGAEGTRENVELVSSFALMAVVGWVAAPGAVPFAVLIMLFHKLYRNTRTLLRVCRNTVELFKEIRGRKPTGKSKPKKVKSYTYKETVRQLQALQKYHADLKALTSTSDKKYTEKGLWLSHAKAIGYEMARTSLRGIDWYRTASNASKPVRAPNEEAGFSAKNLLALEKPMEAFMKEVTALNGYMYTTARKAKQLKAQQNTKKDPKQKRSLMQRWRDYRKVARANRQLRQIVLQTVQVCHPRILALYSQVSNRLNALETEL